MTPEVIERIEQIRHGNVPEGYIKVETAIIPSKWREVMLGDVINIFRGASPRPKGDPRYYGGSIPRLLIEDLTRDGKYAIPKIDFLTEEGARKSRLLPKGSLVMSCSGTRVGIIGFLGIDACIHDGFFGFNGYQEIEQEYLYQYFQLFSQNLQSSATQGGVFNNLTTDIMKTMKCCFPPIDEQYKIVEILTTQDKIIEQKEKLLAEKLRQKKYLMQRLLDVNLLDNNSSFLVRIGDVGTFYGGLSGKNSEDFGVGHSKYITFKNVIGNTVIDTEILEKVAVDAEETQNTVKKGDLFFNLSSETAEEVGMCAVLLSDIDDTYLNSFCVGFRINAADVAPLYLAYYFNGPAGRKIMYSLAQGITRINLNKAALINQQIKIPSYNRQIEVTQILSTADSEIDLLRQSIEQEKQKKKALMQLLLTGIVRVTNDSF